jgi:hypothetical protein
MTWSSMTWQCLHGCRVGDVNEDGVVNVSDPPFIIAYIYSGEPAPEPLERGDANCDGSTNISDAVFIITYIFSGGLPPGWCCNCNTNWCE